MKIVIFGSGLIGRCWALLFARAGNTVQLYDKEPAQLNGALDDIESKLKGLQSSGLLQGQAVADVLKRISTTTDLDGAITGADYLQECVPDIVDLKRNVFAQLDALVEKTGNSKIILASSTSVIPASTFTEPLKHRSRCLVAHPINPPHYIPVVEVVPAPWTSPEVTAETRRILDSIGQAPVVLNCEVEGFLVNRLQFALLMEGYRLVEAGVCSPADIDTTISKGLGLRWSFMGPFQTIDLNAPGGVDDYCKRYNPGVVRVCKDFGETKDPSPETVAAINAAMREEVPFEDLAKRREWRDNRLAALAVHKLQMDQLDKASKQ
ncbi:3-hydroxyacyl-CoA dehydrogenase [Capsaspora owczarzaki ATCC 30864]|uniref:L-gulonate 3-dehydrogenase n=1 Tax=Capsaspora owczarzaki (strain ATCC 30864) TaxID=595528 RepID=A0A0D2WQ34_CAPO3|nr:3-hydroxyacyl-CoA dehydrogenase [Capsaspora owczarzaki ATCC 30864]KJE93670.1 3-hydroxyacyl-CoA dehydrogenase [Capsaspora owczarzaki ATCC 30864]|eukprot:XP_004348252.1 3-hydroxyacyl-CoA dehydrogenase [Capsaspora owczarzaki ATCC 30864]